MSGDGDSAEPGESLGHRRLAGELNMFRAEFDRRAAGAETTDGWVDRGRELLDLADVALEAGSIEQGWTYLHAARRLAIDGLAAVGGEAAIRGEARSLLVEADHAPLSWRAEAIRERLAAPDGTLKDELTGEDLRAALEHLHDGYESVHRKRQHLQAQFRHLWRGALATILLVLLFAIGGVGSGLFPSPFLDFAATDTGETDTVGFLVYVVLFGILGAAVFGLRSLRRQPATSSTPQYLTPVQAATARVVVGASAALAVFFFVRGELVTVETGAGLSRGPVLVAIAFAAGYSQRLVHTAVESVGGATGDAD